MTEDIVTTEQLREYLGVDADKDAEIAMLRDAAIESINRATGIDWRQRQAVHSFSEAVRVSVWLSYYAVRDASKNTEFLDRYLTGLLCSLQLCRGEESRDGI